MSGYSIFSLSLSLSSPPRSVLTAAHCTRTACMLRSLFAVGATNKKAIVYSTDTGDPVATFVAKGGINAVAFSGAGANARLIAGTFTSDLQMWRVENDGGEAECELKYGDIVFCMAVGADGTRLAVGGAKAHVAVYAIEFPAPTAQMSMEFAPRGPDAFTANVREMYRVPLPGSANVLSVALDLDASLLVTAGEAKIVHVWDISEMPIPDRAPRCNMVASPLLASAGAKGGGGSSVTAPTPPAPAKFGRILSSFKCSSVVHSVSFTATGEHLAVGLSDCTEVYQLFFSEMPAQGFEDGTDEVMQRAVIVEPLLYLECPAQQGGVAFSRSASQLAIAGNQLVTVFDIVSGGTICKMPRNGRVRCVALSSAGGIVVVGGFDRKVTLHDICAGTELQHYSCADDVVRSINLSADSSKMAIGSDKYAEPHRLTRPA